MYWKDYPLCKIKNLSYVQKHGILTGNLLSVRNIVIERFFADTLDDVADALVQPPIIAFLKELKEKVSKKLQEVEQERTKLLLVIDPTRYILGLVFNFHPVPTISPPNRKEYVKLVNQHITSVWRGLFLQVQTV